MMRVAVVGAGLAGLSASLRLLDAGCHVTLLEARPSPGGRAFSYTDRSSGDTLDNGQHAMMGCYHATLRYLHRIDSDSGLHRLRGLSLDFRHSDGRSAVLRAGVLPHPLGMAQGFLNFGMLNVRARLGLLRAAMHLRRLKSGDIDLLHAVSAETWLKDLGQGCEAIGFFWTPVVLATLNAQPGQVSAGYLAIVLKAMFLADASASDLLLPAAGLSDLLIDPAISSLKTSGADIHLHKVVEYIDAETGCVSALRCSDGLDIKCDAVVSTIPPWSLQGLLAASGLCANLQAVLARFIASPIISVHVWLKRDPQIGLMTGTFGTMIQWLFSKGRSDDGTWKISCTISAADALDTLTQEELRALTTKELLQLIPSLCEDDIVRVLPLRERRATFVPEPGLDAVRPGSCTETRGLYLAGDWTATGLPATIEGAVLSGEMAAQAVIQDSAME